MLVGVGVIVLAVLKTRLWDGVWEALGTGVLRFPQTSAVRDLRTERDDDDGANRTDIQDFGRLIPSTLLCTDSRVLMRLVFSSICSLIFVTQTSAARRKC